MLANLTVRCAHWLDVLAYYWFPLKTQTARPVLTYGFSSPEYNYKFRKNYLRFEASKPDFVKRDMGVYRIDL
jgi:hypothetical protein